MRGVWSKILGGGLTALFSSVLFVGLSFGSLRAATPEDLLYSGSRRCSLDLAELSSSFGNGAVSQTPVSAWIRHTATNMWQFLTGPSFVAGTPVVENAPPQAFDNLYFHLLPGRAKALRRRLNAQEVNEVFSELLLRLNVALAHSGVTVTHQGMITEYKSLRFVIASEDIRVEEISKAVSVALAQFETSLQKNRPEVYELLKGKLANEKGWINFGIGPTEHKAAVASSYSSGSKHSYADFEVEIKRDMARLLELVKTLPTEIESLERLHFVSISKGGQKTLSFELFEILRSSEDVGQLAELLSAKFQPPGVLTGQEKQRFESVVARLWELRELLKEFTPPNQYDREQTAAFDDQKSVKVEQADRLLSIDLKGVGARLSQEMFHSLQAYVARGDFSQDPFNSVGIGETVAWLKSRVQTARARLGQDLNINYVADVWVGDEMIIYYRGPSIVEQASALLGSDFRVVDLQLKQPGADKNFSVYAQSTLGLIGEAASKVVEQSMLSRLEPAPQVAVKLRVDSDPAHAARQLVFEVHLLGVSESDRSTVERFMATEFQRLLDGKAEKFSSWMSRIRFESRLHMIAPNASPASLVEESQAASMVRP